MPFGEEVEPLLGTNDIFRADELLRPPRASTEGSSRRPE
ncbi:hypothetical protein ACP4OV_014696 [Aristida adscensionis]